MDAQPGDGGHLDDAALLPATTAAETGINEQEAQLESEHVGDEHAEQDAEAKHGEVEGAEALIVSQHSEGSGTAEASIVSQHSEGSVATGVEEVPPAPEDMEPKPQPLGGSPVQDEDQADSNVAEQPIQTDDADPPTTPEQSRPTTNNAGRSMPTTDMTDILIVSPFYVTAAAAEQLLAAERLLAARELHSSDSSKILQVKNAAGARVNTSNGSPHSTPTDVVFVVPQPSQEDVVAHNVLLLASTMTSPPPSAHSRLTPQSGAERRGPGMGQEPSSSPLGRAPSAATPEAAGNHPLREKSSLGLTRSPTTPSSVDGTQPLAADRSAAEVRSRGRSPEVSARKLETSTPPTPSSRLSHANFVTGVDDRTAGSHVPDFMRAGPPLPGVITPPARVVLPLPPALRAPAGASPFMERSTPAALAGAGGTSIDRYGGAALPSPKPTSGLSSAPQAGPPKSSSAASEQKRAGAESRSAPSSGRKLGPPGISNGASWLPMSPKDPPGQQPSKTKSNLIGLSWAQQEEQLRDEAAHKAEAFRGLFLAQGMRDRHPREQPTHVNPKPRRTVPGRISFHQLGVPPANTGGGTLPPDKIKEGLDRRKAAAMFMQYGIYQSDTEEVQQGLLRNPTPDGLKLDGFMLLEAGDDEFPEGVTAVRLAHRNISTVESADLAYFLQLKVVDLSDNKVPDVGCLATLPALRHCCVASNRLKSLGSFDPGEAFQNLEVLDVSYNMLSSDELLGVNSPLAYLPKLRELDASGNGFKLLPDILGPFQNLQVLRLNENALRGSSLSSIAALPSLSVLSLAHNAISTIPNDGAISSSSSFQSLQLLDLTHNRIADKAALTPLRGLPLLKRLLLAGNPVAVQAVAAEKKKQERKNLLEEAAHMGTALSFSDIASGMLPREDDGDVVRYKKEDARKISIASTLAGGRMVTVNKVLDHQAAGRAAAAAAVASVPEEALANAFERVDGAIDAWALNTVEEEGEEDEEDGVLEDDNTFLTGVGIAEKTKRGKPDPEEIEPPAEAPSAAPERPLWEEVEDPTERLALALGLDPRRLALHTGQLTADSVGSINALRFALNHPLVQADEGLVPTQHHLASTETARLKQRKKLEPLVRAPKHPALPMPASGVPATADSSAFDEEGLPKDAHVVRVQTIEGMLSGMKDRLKSLEINLARKLADASPRLLVEQQGPALLLKASKSGVLLAGSVEVKAAAGEDDGQEPDGDKDDEDDDDDLDKNGYADEDARSDMSPLPDDVIDAIENPDLSDSADEDDIYGASDDDDERADGNVSVDANYSEKNQEASLGSKAGMGPTAAAAAATSVATVYHGVTPSGGASSTLGYS